MRLLWLAAACACGGSERSVAYPREARNAELFAQASQKHDAVAIRRMLRDSVIDGGLWFDDADCERQFGSPAEVTGARLDAFAACLAKLELRPSDRYDALPGVSVLTYGPGIELEARFLSKISEQAGSSVSFIGFAARADETDALPTVSPAALEPLRIAGTRNGPTEASSFDAVPADSWLKVCVDETGAVTGTHVRQRSSTRAARAFVDSVAGWRFKPFVLGGQPVAVCAMYWMRFPLDANWKGHEILPPPPGFVPPGGLLVSPSVLLRGVDKDIVPDSATKEDIQRSSEAKVIGSFKICIDTSGRVVEVKMLRSTRVHTYDQKLMRTMSRWEVKPFLDDGKPVPACTVITYIYSQR
jgi:hypothetical protein